MEREILEYMKYGLVGVLWDAMTEGEAKEALEGLFLRQLLLCNVLHKDRIRD